MSKRYTIVGTFFGSDLEEVNVYKDSVSPSNLLYENITTQSIAAGLTITVDDTVNSLIFVGCSGSCSGSQPTTFDISYSRRYRNFTVDGYPDSAETQVQINSPVSDGPSLSILSQSVDFDLNTEFVIEAIPSASYTFQGWTYSGSNTVVAVDNPLTITRTTFTGSDDFIASASFTGVSEDPWSVTSSLANGAGLPIQWKVIYDYGGPLNVVHDLIDDETEQTRIPTSGSEVNITVYKVNNSGIAQDAGDVTALVEGQGSPIFDTFNATDNVGVGNPFTYQFFLQEPSSSVRVEIGEG